MKKNQNTATPQKGQHYIANTWIEGVGEAFHAINPATGETLWQGHEATHTEVDKAMEAAQAAQKAWAASSLDARAHYLKRFTQQVESRREELLQCICLETGKPRWEALTEVNAVLSKLDISLAAYQERTPERKTKSPEGLSCLRFKPHGVVVVLGAFNFPAHLSNGHIIPALLAGNTVIYKPSELTPAVAQWIMHCWHEAQLPPGVINCLQGGKKTALCLLAQDIQGVYFTGSYQTGKNIHAEFAGMPEVILALEMGGNNPLLIEEVHDLPAAIYTTILSSFITAGQRCTCARRLLIPHTAWGDLFLKTLIKTCSHLKVGAFTEAPEPFMGPVIRYEHALTHLKSQQKLIDLGGKSLLTMGLLKENTGFLSPGILDMTAVSHAPDEEIFAPLVQVYRYNHFEEALELANQTRYGLVAGIISDRRASYEAFYQSAHAGLIPWNRPTTGSSSLLPFGGVGCSGNHRPSAYFAADYCAYPVASQEQMDLKTPEKILPGVQLF